METFNINEPILFGPGKMTASQRFWKWLQNIALGLTPIWVVPTLSPNITKYSAGYSGPGYYKDVTGRVFIRGCLTGAGLTVGGVLFTLPPGFRPANNEPFGVVGYSTGYGMYRVDVLSGGNVIIQAAIAGVGGNPTTALFLNGISFLTY